MGKWPLNIHTLTGTDLRPRFCAHLHQNEKKKHEEEKYDFFPIKFNSNLKTFCLILRLCCSFFRY